MAKVTLSDRFISSPKRVPELGRADYPDSLVPGLALRVTATGHRSFVLITRYGKAKHPTRRALGNCGELTLDEAREKARAWLALIRKGTDPKVEAAKERAKNELSQVNSFRHVAEEFLNRYVKGAAFCELERIAEAARKAQPSLRPRDALRKVMADPANDSLVQKSEREGLSHKLAADSIIRKEFIARWGDRPITDIQAEECASAIRAIVNRGTPYQAHGAFEWLRRLFNWSVGTNEYGVKASPVATLRPSDLIGKKEARARTLSDDELRSVWDACADMGPPYGPLIRMLILTAQREREVSDMEWAEIDFEKALWTIPAVRMKKDNAHIVPLAPEALALLKSIPRFGGRFVFTTTGGAKAVNGFSKAKARIDKLSGVKEWKFHDLRRTGRTHFSALPVQDVVRELVIAHAQPGLRKVYDLHLYLDEKRELLTLWEQRLKGIVSPPPPADVADIEAERIRRAGA